MNTPRRCAALRAHNKQNLPPRRPLWSRLTGKG